MLIDRDRVRRFVERVPGTLSAAQLRETADRLAASSAGAHHLVLGPNQACANAATVAEIVRLLRRQAEARETRISITSAGSAGRSSLPTSALGTRPAAG